jgi:hypothetical protein
VLRSAWRLVASSKQLQIETQTFHDYSYVFNAARSELSYSGQNDAENLRAICENVDQDFH